MIRAASADDVPALADLARRTWADAFAAGLDPADVAAELEATRSERFFADALRTRTILVAEEEDGALVGYAQLGGVRLPEVDARPGDQGLQRLYVDRTAQGRGIGRALLAAALAHPRLAGARRVFLTVWEQNERALRLYESVGFERCGTTTFEIGSEVVEDLVLVLRR